MYSSSSPKADDSGGESAREYLQRTCRICRETSAPHSGRSPVFRTRSPLLLSDAKAGFEEKGSEYELIAPCKCKGTMRWVHRMCLDTWRACCYRTDAYYHCEQCKTKYEMESGLAASLVNNKWLLRGIALLGVIAWVGTTGILIEVGRDTVGPAWEGMMPLDDIFYVNHYRNSTTSYYYDGDLAAADPSSKTKQPFKPASNLSKLEIFKEMLNWLWPRIITSFIVVSFLEWAFFNPSVGAWVNLMVVSYRYYSYNNIFDRVILTGFLAYCIYYIYQDVYSAVASVIRKVTCTRIRNLADHEQ